MVVAKTKFASRAAHTFAWNTNNRFRFDQAAVGHCGTRRCPRDDVAGLHVESSAPHVVFGAVAVIKKNTMHFGSVGMPFSLNDASSDDTRNRCANFVNTFNSQTNVRQRK